MSRIRTVKPELFKHEDLFDAEQNSQLPLRLAFIGLFTVADREGRFKWRPRTLKLDVLPHDFIDFAAILDALERGGFVERYEVGGETYGWIPTFTKHQRFTGKEAEAKSQLPPPPQGNTGETLGKHPDASPSLPRETPGEHLRTQERNIGKERERKGMDQDAAPAPDTPTAPPSATAAHPTTTAEFEALWNEYPQRNGSNPKHKALSAWNARCKEGHTPEEMLTGVQRYAAWCQATGKIGTEFVKQVSTFLGPEKGFTEVWDLPIADLSPRNGQRPSQPVASAFRHPEADEFEEILRNLNRPVIEGEVIHEIH
jgi:hypothetical protein